MTDKGRHCGWNMYFDFSSMMWCIVRLSWWRCNFIIYIWSVWWCFSEPSKHSQIFVCVVRLQANSLTALAKEKWSADLQRFVLFPFCGFTNDDVVPQCYVINAVFGLLCHFTKIRKVSIKLILIDGWTKQSLLWVYISLPFLQDTWKVQPGITLSRKLKLNWQLK